MPRRTNLLKVKTGGTEDGKKDKELSSSGVEKNGVDKVKSLDQEKKDEEETMKAIENYQKKAIVENGLDSSTSNEDKQREILGEAVC